MMLPRKIAVAILAMALATVCFGGFTASADGPVSEIGTPASVTPGKDVCSQISQPTEVTFDNLDPSNSAPVRKPTKSFVPDGKGGCAQVNLVVEPAKRLPKGTKATDQVSSGDSTTPDAVFTAAATTYKYINWTCSYNVWGEIAGGVKIAGLYGEQDYQWFNLYNIITWYDRSPWGYSWVPTGGQALGWHTKDWYTPTVKVSSYIPNSSYPIELRTSFVASFVQKLPLIGTDVLNKTLTAKFYSKGSPYYGSRCRVIATFG